MTVVEFKMGVPKYLENIFKRNSMFNRNLIGILNRICTEISHIILTCVYVECFACGRMNGSSNVYATNNKTDAFE